jgi:hypothetical protein
MIFRFNTDVLFIALHLDQSKNLKECNAKEWIHLKGV